eukprot:2642205-Rhodomonas_salina.1
MGRDIGQRSASDSTDRCVQGHSMGGIAHGTLRSDRYGSGSNDTLVAAHARSVLLMAEYDMLGLYPASLGNTAAHARSVPRIAEHY